MSETDDYNSSDDAYKSWELAIKALRLKHVAEGKDVPRNEEERKVVESFRRSTREGQDEPAV